LVADLDTTCYASLRSVATLSPVDDYVPWETREFWGSDTADPEELRWVEKVERVLGSEPSLAGDHQRYAAFRKRVSKSLPKDWWRGKGRFTVATSPTGSRLLFVELATDMRGKSRKSGESDGFASTWLGIFCVTPDEQLVSLAPQSLPDEYRDSVVRQRRWLKIVGPPNTLPIIFYMYDALRPGFSGAYHYYHIPLLAPPLLE